MSDTGYEGLLKILDDAYQQAAYGKGHRRHGEENIPWENQHGATIARHLGWEAPLFQVTKKCWEAGRILKEAGRDRAVDELLGAINYLALAVLILRERGEE